MASATLTVNSREVFKCLTMVALASCANTGKAETNRKAAAMNRMGLVYPTKRLHGPARKIIGHFRPTPSNDAGDAARHERDERQAGDSELRHNARDDYGERAL